MPGQNRCARLLFCLYGGDSSSLMADDPGDMYIAETEVVRKGSTVSHAATIVVE